MVNINNGAGGSMIIVTGGSYLSDRMSVRSANGDDILQVLNSVIEGQLNVSAGNDTSQTILDNSSIGLDLGTGRTSDFVLRAGKGMDILDIDAVSFARNVNVNLAAGSSAVTLLETACGGNLMLKAASGSDTIQIGLVDVGGNAMINTGNDFDGVWIDDAQIVGNTVINTGSGDDIIGLDYQSGGSYPGSIEFGGRVSVIAGAGEDTVMVGLEGGVDAFGNFTAKSLFNGGPGTDLIDIEGNGNIFDVEPRVVGFEVIN
jgi:hypothetical protein